MSMSFRLRLSWKGARAFLVRYHDSLICGIESVCLAVLGVFLIIGTIMYGTKYPVATVAIAIVLLLLAGGLGMVATVMMLAARPVTLRPDNGRKRGR